MSFRFIWVAADTPEELARVDRMLDQYFGDDPESQEIKKKAKTRSEINHQNYLRRKEKAAQDGLNLSESDKEERDEKEAVSPLSSSLPFPPITPIPITPIIPSSQEKAEREETVATAEKREGRPKLMPNDREYWNFAGENADLAEAFFRCAKIAPVRSEFGRWIRDLRDLREAGITAEDVKKTVEYMRSQNLPIGAPGSILKTARWLKANPQKSRNRPQTETWSEVAEQMLTGTVFSLGGDGEVIDL